MVNLYAPFIRRGLSSLGGSWPRRSLGQTFVLVVGFVALAHVGCATTIAGRYPHLDRRSVCLVVPGIESDSTEYVFTEANVPISNFHPGLVDRVAPEARTVFEVNPDADPTSVTYLPAPYNQLTCPERFSALPSSDAQNPALPKASVDLLVHEPHQEFVRRAVAEKLANCLSQSGGQLKATEHTMRLDVYLANDGQAVSAYVAQSTLGDRKIEACMVNVLRSTSWPAVVASVPEVSAAPAAPALKTFLAQPAPAGQPPNSGPISEIRLKPQPWVPPASDPGGFRVPRVFVLPLSPLAAGAAVFGFIFFYSSKDALPWMSEMNPITGQPYTSLQEYEAVKQLTQQQISAAQQAHIKATQPQAPPASTPTPSPQAPPQPAPQKQPDCPENERFIPRETHNATGCFTKKGDLQCHSRRHYPCAGVHTHGILTRQKIRDGVCKEIKEKKVRCEGSFSVSGPCGSVSTTTCGKEGWATSGFFDD